jgi:hypothetical protein
MILFHIKILIVRNLNICVYIFSRPIMTGAIELTEFLLLFKLPWFVFLCMCLFDTIIARVYFIIGLWAVV